MGDVPMLSFEPGTSDLTKIVRCVVIKITFDPKRRGLQMQRSGLSAIAIVQNKVVGSANVPNTQRIGDDLSLCWKEIDLPVLVVGDQGCWTERRLRSETHRQNRSARVTAPFDLSSPRHKWCDSHPYPVANQISSHQLGVSKHVSYECNISDLRYCDFQGPQFLIEGPPK